MKVRGTDISDYAVNNAMDEIKPFIQKAAFTELPIEKGEFDLVVVIGVLYTMTLADAMKCLREIQRVGKGKTFVTLAAYQTAIHYPNPIHLHGAARELGYETGRFPEAEKQAVRILSLPVYPGLERESQEYCIQAIREFYKK